MSGGYNSDCDYAMPADRAAKPKKKKKQTLIERAEYQTILLAQGATDKWQWRNLTAAWLKGYRTAKRDKSRRRK